MKKIFFTLLGLVGLLGIFFLWQYIPSRDGKLHIVFCDVGQGDAMYIRTPQGSNILVDSGPDSKVADCLSRHMPFWERRFAFVILTHPHADHLNGFGTVIDRYDIDMFVTEDLANTTAGYKNLLDSLSRKRIPIKHVLFGDQIKSSNLSFAFVGPTASFLHETSPHGTIGETGEFGSLETLISYGHTTTLLTGDSQARELEEALPYLHKLRVLQVPHHGSKYGLSAAILQALTPQFAVISVGTKNKYGHPHKETLDLLQSFSIPIFRTDQKGDVEIISNGEKVEVL